MAAMKCVIMIVRIKESRCTMAVSEQERDCFDQEAFDDLAKAVGQIDNTSEKPL